MIVIGGREKELLARNFANCHSMMAPWPAAPRAPRCSPPWARACARCASARADAADLAEKSGVSSRFLAQLEAGDGNISLERFDAVARALATSPSALLDPRAATADSAGDDERGKLRAAVTELLDRRSSTRARRGPSLARGALRPSHRAGHRAARPARRRQEHHRPQAGRRGSALRFVELDAAIERAAGLTLSEIFQIHGESYYRRLERETLMGLLADGEGMVRRDRRLDRQRQGDLSSSCAAAPSPSGSRRGPRITGTASSSRAISGRWRSIRTR